MREVGLQTWLMREVGGQVYSQWEKSEVKFSQWEKSEVKFSQLEKSVSKFSQWEKSVSKFNQWEKLFPKFSQWEKLVSKFCQWEKSVTKISNESSRFFCNATHLQTHLALPPLSSALQTDISSSWLQSPMVEQESGTTHLPLPVVRSYTHTFLPNNNHHNQNYRHTIASSVVGHSVGQRWFFLMHGQKGPYGAMTQM